MNFNIVIITFHFSLVHSTDAKQSFLITLIITVIDYMFLQML